MSAGAFELEVALLCPACGKETRARVPGGEAAACEACRAPIALDPAGLRLAGEERTVDRCAVCGNKELYLQRDFNRAFGCAIVAVAIALAYHTYYVSLAVGAAVDALLYRLRPQVLVCYKCRSIYRGITGPGKHLPYQLERASKYDKYVG